MRPAASLLYVRRHWLDTANLARTVLASAYLGWEKKEKDAALIAKRPAIVWVCGQSGRGR